MEFKSETLDYGLLRLKPRNDAMVNFLSLRADLSAWQSIMLCKLIYSTASLRASFKLAWQSIILHKVDSTLSSLRSLCKRLWQSIILHFSKFKQWNLSIIGETLNYGLPRKAKAFLAMTTSRILIKPRNEEVAITLVLSLRGAQSATKQSIILND